MNKSYASGPPRLRVQRHKAADGKPPGKNYHLHQIDVTISNWIYYILLCYFNREAARSQDIEIQTAVLQMDAFHELPSYTLLQIYHLYHKNRSLRGHR